MQGQDEPDLERQEELYVDDRRRIAILGMDPVKRLLVSRASWLRGFSTNRLRHGKSKVSGWAGREGDTPRPEAAERPAPHRAITRLAFARVSRNDCSSCGVMIVRIKFTIQAIRSTVENCVPDLIRAAQTHAAMASSKKISVGYIHPTDENTRHPVRHLQTNV